MKNKIKFLNKNITAVILTLMLSVGSFCLVSFDDDDEFELLKNLDIYYSLMRELNLVYVDEINPGDLIKTSIDAMLQSLDPYTNYIPEARIEDYRFMTTGEYGGIGASIGKIDDNVVITGIHENTPADNAGLKVGDIILEVDGKNVEDIEAEEISTFFKGNPNSEMKLRIKRPGREAMMLKTVKREEIKLSNVPYFGMLNDRIGYISLTAFTRDVHSEVKKALTELKEKHHAKAIVLDLRSNPGGLLMESVYIVNLFVHQGQEIVSTRGKVEQWNKSYHAMFTPIDADIPLVVLINSSSASASEIVSGAIQDLDRGVIVGQRSFGKGLVQTTRDLSYNSKLKVTTAKYYIPSGRCIQALDYSHRNEDGSVGRVPDSLITEFSTQNGRPVYDGGGIIPDIKVEPEQYSKISVALIKHHIIFKYATQYTIEHDSIAPAAEFELTEQEYNDFVEFVKSEDFDYETKSEEHYKKLVEVAKFEKYYQKAKSEFEELEQKLAHDRDKDLRMFKEEIKDLLREEIVSRYYYRDGQIKNRLENYDKEIDEALRLFEDPDLNEYYDILRN